jgi:cellulose synthase/poly-beta-1,6-N-acetylglucosamine synthase-like glycosyltransferase
VRFSIGIPIHNEEQNIARLLERLRSDGLEDRGLEQVVVVSSGSTDGSERIVAEFARRWPRVTPLVEFDRRGKASAINVFLRKARDAERLVLVSGDVLPAPGAVLRILAALDDLEVGMAGGRPIPSGQPATLIARVVRLQWELHHRVSLVAPKLGEVVAFRNVVRGIPTDTAVDEASLEAAFRARGYRLAYVADAVIANKGPNTVADFLKQRRRIAAGHRHLRTTSGYRVSTTRRSLVLRAVAQYLARHPAELPVAAVAASLEAWGRLLGAYDLHVRRRNPYIWDVAASTKDPSGSTRTLAPQANTQSPAEREACAAAAKPAGGIASGSRSTV